MGAAMWLVFLAAAVLVLVGGIGGSIVVKHSLSSVPEAVVPLLPLFENIGVSAGIGMALLGVAMLYRKVSRLDAFVGGRTLSSRLRRTRILTKAQEELPAGEGEASSSQSQQPLDAEGTRRMPHVDRT